MDNIDKTCVCDVNRIKHFKKPMYNHLIKPRVLPPLKTKYNDFKTVCSPCNIQDPVKYVIIHLIHILQEVIVAINHNIHLIRILQEVIVAINHNIH